ncbi:MAG TPA: HEAT repeat domain-containing protein, partial [Burkholderiaceae bacterium]|nr:HEAT repeat domain-containing protein [Burkholderiaceae bacterium]
MKPAGGSFKAESEVFVSGKPLNATDLTVGPDGAMYFCTGGRNTEGGIFRVVWKGRVPPTITDIGRGLEAAIRQPEFTSAYARQRIAVVKQSLGEEWDAQIVAVAEDPQAKPEHRVRALNLMQLFGPFPSSEFLIDLADDADSQVRAKAAYLMGIHADETTGAKLVKLLRDKDGTVARVACESLARAGQRPPISHLSPLLGSRDRYVAWAARRALESLPVERWKDLIKSSEHRIFLQASLALMSVEPTRENAIEVLNRASKLMQGFVKDEDFLDTLRLIEVAMHRASITGEDVPELTAQLAEEYPSSDQKMNRELVKILVHLQATSVMDRMLEQLTSTIPMSEKVHVAVHARYMKGWNTRQKLELLKFYEHARTQTGGHSFVGYIENVSRDFFADFSNE